MRFVWVNILQISLMTSQKIVWGEDILMIKVTIGQIVNVMPILRRLVKEEFQGRNAFVAARLIREITKENDTFEIARLELIKYCDKDENGEMIVSEEGNVHIPMDAMKACTEELLKNARGARRN